MLSLSIAVLVPNFPSAGLSLAKLTRLLEFFLKCFVQLTRLKKLRKFLLRSVFVEYQFVVDSKTIYHVLSDFGIRSSLFDDVNRLWPQQMMSKPRRKSTLLIIFFLWILLGHLSPSCSLMRLHICLDLDKKLDCFMPYRNICG